MKKVIALMMFALLLIVAIPCMSNAAVGDVFEYNGFEYKILNETDKTVELTDSNVIVKINEDGNGYNISASTPNPYPAKYDMTEISIPANVQDSNGITYTVKNIGNGALYNHSKLVKLTLPNTITSLEKWAFIEAKMEIIVLPSSLKTIGKETFYNSKLKEITIPNSVKEIEEKAFYYCQDLEKVTIIGDNMTIGEESFCYCKNLKTVNMSGTYKSIGDRVFGECTSLETVIISEGLVNTGKGMFGSCENLKNVTLPNSIKTIEGSAFSGCTNLETIKLPKNLETIGSGAFSSCTNLKEITIPETVTTIGETTFNACNALTNVTIPNSVTKMGYGTFMSCQNLETVTISNAIEEIPYAAFAGCKSLKKVVIPEGVKFVARQAFWMDGELESVTFPKSVERISSDAFDDCWKVVFYAYKDTYPATFANNFNINIVYLNGGNEEQDKDNYEEDVKVVGLVTVDKNAGATITGTELEKNSNEYIELSKELEAEGITNVAGAYELKLATGDVKNGLKLTFNVGEEKNGKTAVVLHKLQSGKIDRFTKTVENGKVEITVYELSPFMIAFKEDNNQGGNNGNQGTENGNQGTSDGEENSNQGNNNTENGNSANENREIDNEPKTGMIDYSVFTNVAGLIATAGLITIKSKKD